MCVLEEARRGCQIPWNWSYRHCESPCVCWESNPGPNPTFLFFFNIKNKWFHYVALAALEFVTPLPPKCCQEQKCVTPCMSSS